jgi:hypothetical protein
MIEALCFFSIVHFTKLRVINRQMDVADFRLFEWKQGLTGFLWKTVAPDWQGQGRSVETTFAEPVASHRCCAF